MTILTHYVDDLLLWYRTEQRNCALLQELASKGHKVSKELLTDCQKIKEILALLLPRTKQQRRGASLVVQWFRICLPVWGTQV